MKSFITILGSLLLLCNCAAESTCQCPKGTICGADGACVFPPGDGGLDGVPPGDQAPPKNQALLCDGIDDELRVKLSGVLPLSSWTLELWLKIGGHLPAGSQAQSILYAPSNDFFDTFNLRLTDWPLSGDRRLRFGAQKRLNSCDGTPQSASPGARELVVGNWHHVAAVIEQDALKRVSQTIYLDGKKESDGTVRWLPHEFPCHELTELVLCGTKHPFDTVSPFVGAIDSLRISLGARYTSDFAPSEPRADSSTILFLALDTLPPVLLGAAADKAQALVSGDPQLIPR